MTKKLKSIGCLAVLCSLRALAASAGAQVIYDNGVTGTQGYSSQLDNSYPFNSQVADNFTLASGNGLQYTVTGITFRGVYFNTPAGSAPATDNFNVFIYA